MNHDSQTQPALILIVEDSPVQAELLRRTIEGAGYRVLAAGNGAEALVLARQHHPAAVVTDVNMPVMSGWALCAAMRADASLQLTPIIVLTMLSDLQDLVRSLNAGADGYLTKPYDTAALLSRLHALLENPPARLPIDERRKVTLQFGGQTHVVNADSRRMLELLISTYENALQQKRALNDAQEALEDLNLHLAQRVEEQTAELRAHERRFRSLIEHSSEIVAVINAQGSVSYVSPAIKALAGFEVDDVMGRRFLDFVHPQDLAATSAVFADLHRQPDQSCTAEFRLHCKDDSWVLLDAFVRNALGDPAIDGIVINARDITGRRHSEDQIQLQLKQLEAAFLHTVDVVTQLSGIRDPYTSSHERRVADLATAIGAVLGFDAARQQGLRVASLLHDVGKISVPVDILNKPGRLSPLEYQLIQEHSQIGFDLLKDVELPWPVAQVALQHHERIDGSGYPNGLKGEAILLEARIVAVADVIEAMSSHRPYRAGLGIEAALLEIERGLGTFYDSAAANAALKLFRDQGYCIPK